MAASKQHGGLGLEKQDGGLGLEKQDGGLGLLFMRLGLGLLFMRLGLGPTLPLRVTHLIKPLEPHFKFMHKITPNGRTYTLSQKNYPLHKILIASQNRPPWFREDPDSPV